MLRKILVLLAAIVPLPAAALGVISLDRPGALEAIEAANPGHHQRIRAILAASQEMPCSNDHLFRLVSHYDAREARCSLALFTSFPAKRRLTFKLDDQRYVATVVMSEPSRFVKVRQPRVHPD